MTTKFIGIKEFRQNIARYSQAARSKKTRYVVMNRTIPMFEIRPFAVDSNLGTLVKEIMVAREHVREGNVYTHEQVLKELE